MSSHLFDRSIVPLQIWSTSYQITEQDLTSPSKERCPICFEMLQKRIAKTVCNHFFCLAHLSTWLISSSSCPVCRKDLRGGKSDGSIDPGIVFNIYRLSDIIKSDLLKQVDRISAVSKESTLSNFFCMKGYLIVTVNGEKISPCDLRLKIICSILE